MTRPVLAALIGFVLVASACGGKAPDASPASAATQAAASSAPTAAPTTAPTAAPTGNPDQALIDLLRSKSASYKVTYDFSSGPQKGTLTQYVKSPLFRQDMTITAGGGTMTFSTFVRPEGTFTCGAFTGAPSCFNFGSGGGAIPVPQAPQTVPQDLTGLSLVPSTSRTVAGQQARCFTFSGAQVGGAETIGCYSSQGVPLYLSSKVGGSEVVMSATSFSTTVTDADFAIPYPVQKFPGQP